MKQHSGHNKERTIYALMTIINHPRETLLRTMPAIPIA